MSEEELLRIKRAFAPRALAIPSVSGVGITAQGLTVYLEHDDVRIRADIEAALRDLGFSVAVNFAVSGVFRPR